MNPNLTEEQAIEALLTELSDEPQAEQASGAVQEQEPTAKESKEEPIKETEPTKEQSKLDMILQSLQEMKGEPQANEPKQELEQEPQIDQKAIDDELSSLGLNNLAVQLKQQQAIIAAQKEAMATQQEQARREQVFSTNLAQLKKDFPTIDPDELGKFANEKELIGFLGEDYKGWKLVASHMISLAKPTSSPDPITSSNGKSAEASAFDKIKNGQSVSDIEFGAELLKSIGM